MSLADYAGLNAAVAAWMQRSDLTSNIPDGIVLAEAKMNRYFVQNANEIGDPAFMITGEFTALPTGFGGVRTFYLNTSPKTPLIYMPSDTLTTLYGSGTAKPRYYDIIGDNFRFGPIPAGSYSSSLFYFLKTPALTGAATTNWVLTSHPDAYLYGTNAEMAGLMKDSENEAKWNARFYQVMEEIVSAARRNRWGAGMAVRLG